MPTSPYASAQTEQDDRTRKALHVTIVLTDLLVGEEYWMGNVRALRVIGGWLYEAWNFSLDGPDTLCGFTFVPLPEEPVIMQATSSDVVNVPSVWIDILEEAIGPKVDLTSAPCHNGITTAEHCGRCSRELKARTIINKLREVS